MSDQRRGFLFGVAAYGIWGLFPLYWPLLEPAGAVEILAHRVLWSALVMTLVTVLMRRLPHLRQLATTRGSTLLLALAAVVISVNWTVYIWAVNNHHVVDAALGYYINPLVTVLMAVVLLGERLRPLQWASLGLAVAAVGVLTVEHGRLPWIALVLACSFGTYGLAKKKAGAGAVESLTFETLLVAPLAAAYVGWLAMQGQSSFGVHGTAHTLLMMGAGIATALPLVCFGAAATRLPLVALGLLQYLTPTMQFLFGVLLFGEAMPPARWAGFILVWVALALFSWESIGHRRRQLRLAAEASAA